MRRRNPLGIIITGYGRSPYGFAGPGRVARRGLSGPYFYGLGYDDNLFAAGGGGATFRTAGGAAGPTATLAPTSSAPSLYRTDDLALSTTEVEAKRAQELSKLAAEVESLSPRAAEQVASQNLRALDQQLATERAAQALVNERGEALYPATATIKAALLIGSDALTKAAIAERATYNEALAKAAAADLRPPTTDDPAAWMAYEAALARRAGQLPPSAPAAIPPTAGAVVNTCPAGYQPTVSGGCISTAEKKTAEAAAMAALNAAWTCPSGYTLTDMGNCINAAGSQVAPTPRAAATTTEKQQPSLYVDSASGQTASSQAQAQAQAQAQTQALSTPAASGAGGAVLLGGAALALFLLLR